MKVNFNLELVALDSGDLEKLRAWRNDYRIWRWCRQQDVISDLAQADWHQAQHKDPSIRMYGVQIKVEGMTKLIGVAGFTSLDFQNRRAEFSLYIAPENQGKGFGKESLRVLLSHGFGNLGLNQIYGESFEGNPALKIFADLGFKSDGKKRQFYFKDGQFLDAHMVSILKDEWLDTLPKAEQSA